MASRHWLYFGGFVLSGILLAGAGLFGVLDALSVLSGGGYDSVVLLLLAMLEEAAEWLVAVLVLGLFAVVFLAATVVSVLRNVSLPRSDRVAGIVEWLEKRYPILRRFEVAERVEPTTEARKQRLKEQYVAGEISEEAFEREMERLLDTDDSDGGSRDRTAVERE